MGTGGHKIKDEGAMYFVSFVPKVRDESSGCIYKKRL